MALRHNALVLAHAHKIRYTSQLSTVFCTLYWTGCRVDSRNLLTRVSLSRHDERRGVAPSGARLPHAVSAELPVTALRHYARVLAQGPAEATHLRDAAVEAGGLLHYGQLRV